PPDVSWGDMTAPGRNAFTSNRGDKKNGANFRLTNVPGPISAIGNQWGSCGNLECTKKRIRDNDLLLQPTDAVVLVEPSGIIESPRGSPPTIVAITPARPRAGDIVRIYGDGFDAINGNPTRGDGCESIGLPSCSAEKPCPTGPCVAGTCPCSIRADG